MPKIEMSTAIHVLEIMLGGIIAAVPASLTLYLSLHDPMLSMSKDIAALEKNQNTQTVAVSDLSNSINSFRGDVQRIGDIAKNNEASISDHKNADTVLRDRLRTVEADWLVVDSVLKQKGWLK